MRQFFTLFVLLFCAFHGDVFSQKTTPRRPAPPARPRLVVGIVVDQMRYDYLYRYQSKYGSGGFKRLLREGFSCENTHFNYVPTFTACGHAAIYTGAPPSVSGIIANEWFDPEWGKHRYVTTDERYRTVGAPGKAGQHSPGVLLSSSISDELRLSNNFESKVVGICIKDRGSILPAGHIPNACYWFDDATGHWITSTYYPDSLGLPQWVQQFNARQLPASYLAQSWTTKAPEHSYHESFKDWERYENRLKGDPDGKFPHELSALQKSLGSGFGLLRNTPFANTLTVEFAMSAIENMGLGADASPDMLCLSFSATDYCGHQFGIHATETEDTYLRLDAELARFLDFLDKKLGKQNVLVFLTADHGAAETPRHMQDLRIPAGVLPESRLDSVINAQIGQDFGKTGRFVHEISNQQVWFDKKELARTGIPQKEAEQLTINHLRSLQGVYDAFSRAELMALPADYPFVSEIRRGIYPRRSGDVMFQLEPAWHPDDTFFATGGTTHGSPYAYDTHVPLVWHGWKIRPGETFAPVSITDIAPTLAAMLRIMEPNGNTGKVIGELLEGKR